MGDRLPIGSSSNFAGGYRDGYRDDFRSSQQELAFGFRANHHVNVFLDGNSVFGFIGGAAVIGAFVVGVTVPCGIALLVNHHGLEYSLKAIAASIWAAAEAWRAAKAEWRAHYRRIMADVQEGRI